MKLCIDPGHGGAEPGGTGYGKREKDVVLAIGYEMMRQAEDRGLLVMLTRTGDKTVAINTRYEIANAWGADLFLSIHTNASGGRGIEVLYGKPHCRQLAAELADELCRVTGWPMRRGDGTWYRPTGVGVLRGTRMPAVLSENGFIDISSENAAMSNPDWIRRVAKAHIDVACRYLWVSPARSKEDEDMAELRLDRRGGDYSFTDENGKLVEGYVFILNRTALRDDVLEIVNDVAAHDFEVAFYLHPWTPEKFTRKVSPIGGYDNADGNKGMQEKVGKLTDSPAREFTVTIHSPHMLHGGLK